MKAEKRRKRSFCSLLAAAGAQLAENSKMKERKRWHQPKALFLWKLKYLYERLAELMKAIFSGLLLESRRESFGEESSCEAAAAKRKRKRNKSGESWNEDVKRSLSMKVYSMKIAAHQWKLKLFYWKLSAISAKARNGFKLHEEREEGYSCESRRSAFWLYNLTMQKRK